MVNKIVELIINLEEFEFDDLGVEIMSLVDKPAIEVGWMAFAEDVEFRENADCPDGFEHEMPDGTWMCGKTMAYVDNTGFEKFAEFFNANIDLFKKPGGGAAGEGSVNHAEQMKKLNEAGISTEFPFGYCYQVAQFLFYAVGGYDGEYDLKCIKGMEYQVDGVDFSATHWYIQNKKTNAIIDLTASQFDDILNIKDYYSEGKRANLGFPYYNVGNKRVLFDNTVPSLQSLKLYAKWKEDNEDLPGLEEYYTAAKYEKLRKDFAEQEYNFVDEEEEEYQKALLKLADEIGTVIDPEEIIYVDGTKENFATVGDFLQGARAIAALGDLPASTPARLVYRYAGPSGQRFFCRALKGLNKIYSREEITRMNRLNPGFGPGGSNSYSVFEYKGGPNCQHYWEELVQFQDGRNNVLVSNGPAIGNAGDSNNSNDPSPDGAVSNNAYLMSKHWSFSDDDKMIITGPAMIPNALIARKDEMGNVFHVYFSKETVEKVARKFLADNNAHVTDINHDDNIVEENTLLESWIVEDPKMDKSAAMGFKVPKSTWMVSYKINNKDTWNKIKAGELNGFSVAGSFLEKTQSNG